MEVNVLDKQVGGSHYKKLTMQPIDFIVKAKLSFIQGNIVKYISRYINKNGIEDIKKCIHYSELAISLNDSGPEHKMLNLAYSYCMVNNFGSLQSNIIIACVQDDYYAVIKHCERLIKHLLTPTAV